MAHSRRTMALTAAWDVHLNDTGGIALLEGADATAQNVANECRLFDHDAYFEQDHGIPYFLYTLGKRVATTALRSYLRKATVRVDDVKRVEIVQVDGFDSGTRTLTGSVTVITVGDEKVVVEL